LCVDANHLSPVTNWAFLYPKKVLTTKPLDVLKFKKTLKPGVFESHKNESKAFKMQNYFRRKKIRSKAIRA
jgi:hypothetical protein